MPELIGSILSSSALFFLFRLFPVFRIDTAQAIVVNYFVAFLTGCAVNRSVPSFPEMIDSGLLPWLLLAGFLFISLFIAMGYSSVSNGIGTTSVAVKMSMALSMLFFMIAYNEPATIQKLTGFALAFAGILLLTYQRSNNRSDRRSLLLLLFLFTGSSGLDILLNYVQKMLLNGYPDSLFTAFGFLAAGSFGCLWLITEFVRRKRTFSLRNVLAGIVLGIPNYFSIFLLVRSYTATGWEDTTTLAVLGISIVLITASAGILIFKESAKWPRMLGLISAVSAILLLTALSGK